MITELFNTWTSAEQPPQDENEYVLLWFEYGGITPFEVGYFVKPDRWFIVSGHTCKETDAPPAYWIPLPKAPAESCL